MVGEKGHYNTFHLGLIIGDNSYKTAFVYLKSKNAYLELTIMHILREPNAIGIVTDNL